MLRKSGLVLESGLENDARVRVYTLRRDRFADLADWIAEVEAFWTEQLGAFAAHVAERAATTQPAKRAKPAQPARPAKKATRR